MEKNRNGIQVMAGLVGMVKPLILYMLVAVLMGCVGNLMATFITVLGGMGIGILLGQVKGISLTNIFIIMVIFAILRGVLRYVEQASNHFIAFKLLAHIRHQIFDSLRRLAPAKLDGKEKGNLISIITSDIELLEVFYAHTISPIMIAGLTSLVMVIFMGNYQPVFGAIALCFYVIVGVIIPIINSLLGQKCGQTYRKIYGKLNTVVLDNLYGMNEIQQFEQQENRKNEMEIFTDKLEMVNKKLKGQETVQKIFTDLMILTAGIFMAVVSFNMATLGKISTTDAMIVTIAMMSSFGPVAALSALSNNLNQTLASGNRVLNILEECPMTEEILDGKEVKKGDILADNISFRYEEQDTEILKEFSIRIKQNQITGILGKSGCGKSTLLKLFLRFYETNQGKILYENTNVNEIQTSNLRKHISYVTQETFLFQDTIENNIKIAKENATHEEVVNAAKKASVHEFIMSLPNGYDTVLAELGDSVSGGERQRIGIARAFLNNAPVIFLDEPTSNIDSLNECIILKSLIQEKENKTIVLVSHRVSTMAIADNLVNLPRDEVKYI